ncbi:MAG: ATP-binding protein, partial [Clostridiales bacterium]|nr:ATP-binding protein [Clostridiales bacterium]
MSFGRKTAQMEIEPFDFFNAVKFFEKYNDVDKVIAYSITGGVAQYLDMWDSDVGIEDNIREKFLSKYSYLFDEPLNLLKQELREPNLYSSILKAISEGYS